MRTTCIREVVRSVALAQPTAGRASIEGLMNLRGEAVPVISLQAALGVPQPPLAASDFLIIAETDGGQLVAIRATGEVKLRDDVSVREGDESNLTGLPLAMVDDAFHSLVEPGQLLAQARTTDRPGAAV